MRKLLLIICLTALSAIVYLWTKSSSDTAQRETPSSFATSTSGHAAPITAPPMARETPPPRLIVDKKELASTSEKKLFDKPYDYFQKRLEFLNRCFKRRCKLSNKDPKSYELAVFSEIENTLLTLKDWQSRHNFTDERIPLLMNSFLAYEKSEIKVIALEILATQPKDERVVPHVLKNVIDQAHPAPIRLAMKELSRYKNGKFKTEIENTVLNVLTQGSVFSAIEVAKNIKPVLNSGNRAKFSAALEELSHQPLTKDIQVALKESLN